MHTHTFAVSVSVTQYQQGRNTGQLLKSQPLSYNNLKEAILSGKNECEDSEVTYVLLV